MARNPQHNISDLINHLNYGNPRRPPAKEDHLFSRDLLERTARNPPHNVSDLINHFNYGNPGRPPANEEYAHRMPTTYGAISRPSSQPYQLDLDLPSPVDFAQRHRAYSQSSAFDDYQPYDDYYNNLRGDKRSTTGYYNNLRDDKRSTTRYCYENVDYAGGGRRGDPSNIIGRALGTIREYSEMDPPLTDTSRARGATAGGGRRRDSSNIIGKAFRGMIRQYSEMDPPLTESSRARDATAGGDGKGAPSNRIGIIGRALRMNQEYSEMDPPLTETSRARDATAGGDGKGAPSNRISIIKRALRMNQEYSEMEPPLTETSQARDATPGTSDSAPSRQMSKEKRNSDGGGFKSGFWRRKVDPDELATSSLSIRRRHGGAYGQNDAASESNGSPQRKKIEANAQDVHAAGPPGPQDPVMSQPQQYPPPTQQPMMDVERELLFGREGQLPRVRARVRKHRERITREMEATSRVPLPPNVSKNTSQTIDYLEPRRNLKSPHMRERKLSKARVKAIPEIATKKGSRTTAGSSTPSVYPALTGPARSNSKGALESGIPSLPLGQFLGQLATNGTAYPEDFTADTSEHLVKVIPQKATAVHAPRPPTSLGRSVSDLVEHFKLNTEFRTDCTMHITGKQDPKDRKAVVRVEDAWFRVQHIGNGTFGHVWLEKNRAGRLRAVKVVQKDGRLDVNQELLAMAKLCKVSSSMAPPFIFAVKESHELVDNSMRYTLWGSLAGLRTRIVSMLPWNTVSTVT